MMKVYIGESLGGVPLVEVLFPAFPPGAYRWPFDEPSLTRFLEEPFFELVGEAEQADYFLLPHDYREASKRPDYLSAFFRTASATGKQVIVFSIGDAYIDVPHDNAIVMRMSVYKGEMKKNDIVVPAYANDLLFGADPTYKDKGARARVGFAGYSELSFWPKLKMTLRNVVADLEGLSAHKQGIYFRQRALTSVAGSNLVEANFITRSFYGALEKTIKMDPGKLRHQYIGNILGSDVTLAPRGDGNYSIRFYETLSLGRIPALIDTDCALPLESEIDYSTFILRVPHEEVGKTAEVIADWYKGVSPGRFLEMQKKARETYENVLRIDKFFKRIMSKKYLSQYA